MRSTKYQEELDYEVKYSAHLSYPTTTQRRPRPLNTKEDAEQLVEGDYDLYDKQTRRSWRQHDEENEFWDYDCDAYEIRIFCLKLRNPSAEATQLMEEVRIEKELVVALRDVLDGEGIKKSWRKPPTGIHQGTRQRTCESTCIKKLNKSTNN